MKQRRCTRTSPSSCCRTTSLPAASPSTTSSVYVKQIHEPPKENMSYDSFGFVVLILKVLFCVFQWTDGPPPVQIQAQNGPTTSLASLLWETFCLTCVCSWYIITSSRLMPNNLPSDHCSWDLRGRVIAGHRVQAYTLLASHDCFLIVCYPFFICCKAVTTSVVHVFHTSWRHGCRAGVGSWSEWWRTHSDVWRASSPQIKRSLRYVCQVSFSICWKEKRVDRGQ